MNDLGESALLALFHVYNFMPTDDVGYFIAQAEFYPLLHLWSLNVEEQFYLIWVLLLSLAVARGVPVLRLTGLVAALSLALAVFYTSIPELQPWAFYHPEARMFEFCAGAALAVLEFKAVANGAGRVHRLAYPAGLAMILAGYFSKPLLPEPFHVIPACVGTMLLIAYRPTRPARWLFHSRPLVGIGLISYSLYLVHWPLIVLYDYHSWDPLAAQERWGLLFAALVAAWLLWALVERRFRFVPGRANLSNRSVARACIALGVVTATASVAASLEPSASPRIRPPRNILAAPIAPKPQPDLSVCKKRGLILGCTLNPELSGPHDILFIGDSLAGELWPLANSLATQGLKVHLFFELGCAPIFDTPIYWNKDELNVGCMSKNKQWQAWIMEHRPRSVTLMGNWSRYVHKYRGYGTKHWPRKHLGQGLGNQRARQWFEQRIAHTKRFIQDNGATAIFLVPGPVFPVRAAECYLTPRVWVSEAVQLARCEENTMPHVSQRTQAVAAAIQSNTRGDPRAFVVRIDKLFCDYSTQRCQPFDPQGRLVFRDHHHLNEPGVRYVTSAIEPRVRQLLGYAGVSGRP